MKRKSKVRRETILQAAFDVVCAQGYYETKMDDVAQKAGVAKGTVYLYFKDKPDLYVGIVKWLIGQARAIVAEVAGNEQTPSRKLHRVFERWIESLMNRPAAIDLVFPELREERCEISRRFHEQVMPELKGLVDDIARLVKAGVQQGEFRRVEPRLAALSFLNAFRAALLVSTHRLKVRVAPMKALDIFFNGIRRRL